MARLTDDPAEGPITPARPSPRRRDMVRGGLGLLIAGSFGARTPCAQGTAPPTLATPTLPTHMFPDGATFTVAGPDGGELDIWAESLLRGIGRFLPGNPPMRRILAGGLDGITGANQFSAQALPDGSAALLAPGTAALAWLLGDARVQPDLGHCMPLLEGFCPLMLVGRIDTAALARGQKLRVGISAPNGREIAAVLGLERLGLVPVAVPGLVDLALTQAAFAQHTIDVMLLRGTDTAMTTTTPADARPICILGVPDAGGAVVRNRAMPDLPHLGELLGGMPADPLTGGWYAAVSAAQQVFSLVLPPLTPAALVAQWRRAVDQAITLPDIASLAATQALRLHHNPTRLTNDPTVLAALRAWFAERRRG